MGKRSEQVPLGTIFPLTLLPINVIFKLKGKGLVTSSWVSELCELRADPVGGGIPEGPNRRFGSAFMARFFR